VLNLGGKAYRARNVGPYIQEGLVKVGGGSFTIVKGKDNGVHKPGSVTRDRDNKNHMARRAVGKCKDPGKMGSCWGN